MTAPDVARLPKVELHLHLDCSLSYDVVARLAPEVTRTRYCEEFIAPAKCTNLADFLTRAPKGVALMQTESALGLVVHDLFAQLARDGVLYAEVRFAPLLHTAGGLSPEAVVAAVAAATDAAVRETGVEARLILCTLRHFSEAESLATARLVDAFRGTRVVALDLAADEAGFPIDAHVAAYAYARERGLARTAHAGEACGPESVWDTLRRLHPSRIGHGVRSVEDPALVAHLAAEGIHLEVCPTSNVQTDVVPTLADHPVDRLYRAGVSLGINTDARTITDVTLADEYARLAAVFGWTAADFLACNEAALRAAFLPDDVRAPLLERVRRAYAGAPSRNVGCVP